MDIYMIGQDAYTLLLDMFPTIAALFSELPGHSGVYYAPQDSEGLDEEFFMDNDIYFKEAVFTMSTVGSLTFP